MTNEEAIEVLAQDLPCETDEDLVEAMAMAIKALETVSCIKEKCAYCPHCENCDVDDETLEIKALEQQPCEDWYDVPSDEMTLEQARQAVKDLRKKLAEYLEQQPCEDAVSRQAVNDLVDELARAISDERCHMPRGRATGRIMQDILDLPSVTPKEKTGKWIKTQSGDDMFPEIIVCSKCNNENSHLDFNEHAEPIGKVFIKSRYCPNCGARMH